MTDKVRVRFAPSPTGRLHVGNARTAIVNWLCSRHYSGEFVLRLEDTDVERSTRESEQGIIDLLKWLGLDWDEGPEKGGEFGPYRQSERKFIYREEVAKLLDSGAAYFCFCTKEELEIERQRAMREKRSPGYSGKCGNLTGEEQDKYRSQGRKPVVRFRVPDDKVVFKDLVKGNITFDSGTITDFVIQREDGSSPYNLAVVADDAYMKISHVIRGDDHLPNTPKQILLYEALGCKIPEFAHIPMITGPDGVRLSKRHGHTSIEEFRDAGYLPEAMINYLSLLSWSSETGDEILSIERLIGEFEFKRISRSPAAFDPVKLNWLNGVYIRALTTEERVEQAAPHLEKANMLEKDHELRVRIIEAVKDNVETLSDFPKYAAIFFKERVVIAGDEEKELVLRDSSQLIFQRLREKLPDLHELTVEGFQNVMQSIQKETGIKGRDLWMPVRVALTGQMHGPELPKVLEILGLERCVTLLKAASQLTENNHEEVLIYNTLSRKKEKFVPVHEGEVRLYTCGPTVYNHIHIGNARPLIFFDVVRRYFQYLNYDVIYVQNITDIDDKIIAQAKEEGLTTDIIAKKYTDSVFEDCRKLGVGAPDKSPKATQYVSKMIELIKTLVEKGFAYEVDGNVFFETAKDADYGILSGKDLHRMEVGERLDEEIQQLKKDHRDFSLWKAAKQGEPFWESPWGNGRPGWHTECVVMSTQLLGRAFDIHAGGVDLIFPHHENEFAQARCSSNPVFARYWMHNEFVNLREMKMAKSGGNVVLVRELAKKFRKEAIRLFFLNTRYRKPINFDEGYIQSAESGVEKINKVWFKIRKFLNENEFDVSNEKIQALAERHDLSQAKDEALRCMNADFNTAGVIGWMFTMIDTLDQTGSEGKEKYALYRYGYETLLELNEFMGIIPETDKASGVLAGITLFRNKILGGLGPEYSEDAREGINARIIDDPETFDESEIVERNLELREYFRARKDWKMSDLIRTLFDEMGIIIEDTKEGTHWHMKL